MNSLSLGRRPRTGAAGPVKDEAGAVEARISGIYLKDIPGYFRFGIFRYSAFQEHAYIGCMKILSKSQLNRQERIIRKARKLQCSIETTNGTLCAVCAWSADPANLLETVDSNYCYNCNDSEKAKG